METIGSLVDKITILKLKIFHMKEQISSKSYDKIHVKDCSDRLEVLNDQQNDLIAELNNLFIDVNFGRKKIKVYRQFKMYNDQKYRLSPKR